MTCDEFRDLAFDYLGGTLGDPAVFRTHLGACPSCAESLRGIEANEKALAAARVPLAPVDLWPAIAARLSRGRTLPFRRTKIASGLAAAAALLFAVALFFSGGPSKPRLDVVIQEVSPEAGRAMGVLVPRYEDVDTAGALADTMFR
jgi:anti-sigma factor RsiW